MKHTLVIAVLAFALGLVACDDDEPDFDFVFTPVPYTVVTVRGGTPVPVSGPDTALYKADEVRVAVENPSIDGFWNEVRRLGFTEKAILVDRDGLSLVLVGVPVGSVIDAIPLLAAIEGVQSAELSSLPGLLNNDAGGEQ